MSLLNLDLILSLLIEESRFNTRHFDIVNRLITEHDISGSMLVERLTIVTIVCGKFMHWLLSSSS